MNKYKKNKSKIALLSLALLAIVVTAYSKFPKQTSTLAAHQSSQTHGVQPSVQTGSSTKTNNQLLTSTATATTSSQGASNSTQSKNTKSSKSGNAKLRRELQNAENMINNQNAMLNNGEGGQQPTNTPSTPVVGSEPASSQLGATLPNSNISNTNPSAGGYSDPNSSSQDGSSPMDNTNSSSMMDPMSSPDNSSPYPYQQMPTTDMPLNFPTQTVGESLLPNFTNTSDQNPFTSLGNSTSSSLKKDSTTQSSLSKETPANLTQETSGSTLGYDKHTTETANTSLPLWATGGF